MLTGDELFSDVYSKEMTLKDDMYYEVRCKQIQFRTDVSDAMIGGNASAEGVDADDSADGACIESGINIVVSHRLVKVGWEEPEDSKGRKKTLVHFFKKYCKKLATKLSPERQAIFKENMPTVLKMLNGNIKNWDFYAGENWDEESDEKLGLVMFLDFKNDDDGEEYPYMIILKDGLLEEKV